MTNFLIKLRADVVTGAPVTMEVYPVLRETGRVYTYEGTIAGKTARRTLNREAVGRVRGYTLRRALWLTVEAESELEAIGDAACADGMRRMLREIDGELRAYGERLRAAMEANHV